MEADKGEMDYLHFFVTYIATGSHYNTTEISVLVCLHCEVCTCTVIFFKFCLPMSVTPPYGCMHGQFLLNMVICDQFRIYDNCK